MKEIYVPDKDLSLDESMMPWRRRLVFRQYLKNKRDKYGVMFYELCESDGMVLRVSIYFTLPRHLWITAKWSDRYRAN